MAQLTRTDKYRRYRAAIAKIDERDLATPATPPVLTPIPPETDPDTGVTSRATRTLPLEEIIKGADVIAGKQAGPVIDPERISTRHFVIKVVLVCLLAALFIVALVLWMVEGGGV